ncbi:hypothetical protein POM88_044968 [Heracleum sosnowskyi]|uniref:Uncharacterized protein n=1 Tax=Heracleum sosnowskyi TaxID=360622 RepID=A0AAD8H6E1_9APIA|nr:hypothetical protein POM88_044968 [Heracleum sosnowskyi]
MKEVILKLKSMEMEAMRNLGKKYMERSESHNSFMEGKKRKRKEPESRKQSDHQNKKCQAKYIQAKYVQVKQKLIAARNHFKHYAGDQRLRPALSKKSTNTDGKKEAETRKTQQNSMQMEPSPARFNERLGNMDAEFYWVCKSVVLRNHVYYDILQYSYKIIEELSEKGHMLSLLFKNMFDIYFLPEKREDVVNAIIIMNTSPETKHAITGMIMALKKISGEIYPDTIFDALSGAPIYNAHLPNDDNHYQPDGYPVHPDQIDDYTCVK